METWLVTWLETSETVEMVRMVRAETVRQDSWRVYWGDKWDRNIEGIGHCRLASGERSGKLEHVLSIQSNSSQIQFSNHKNELNWTQHPLRPTCYGTYNKLETRAFKWQSPSSKAQAFSHRAFYELLCTQENHDNASKLNIPLNYIKSQLKIGVYLAWIMYCK